MLVPKISKPLGDLSSYSPVYLLGTMGKVLRRLMVVGSWRPEALSDWLLRQMIFPLILVLFLTGIQSKGRHRVLYCTQNFGTSYIIMQAIVCGLHLEAATKSDTLNIKTLFRLLFIHKLFQIHPPIIVFISSTTPWWNSLPNGKIT